MFLLHTSKILALRASFCYLAEGLLALLTAKLLALLASKYLALLDPECGWGQISD